MTVYNPSLVKLLTECDTKLTILLGLNPEHELERYHCPEYSLFKYSKLLIEFMREFYPKCQQPDSPTMFDLFLACRAFLDALDQAILTELFNSAEEVSPTLVEEDSALLRLLSMYKDFLLEVDKVSLHQ